MRTRIKICGLTRAEDAQAAARLGADALGLVFYPPSPRSVSLEQAQAVVAGLPPFLTLVGLFVDAEPACIQAVINQVGVQLLQFHGDETPAACAAHGRPWIKALRMTPGLDLLAQRRAYGAASALLLDAYHPTLRGGTGERFDWERIPPELAGDIILAGGLNPDNVEQAVRQTRPYAVDVSGGVELAKGIKDPARIRAFIEGVGRGDGSTN